jgi:predicted acyltransferase (DUF342 family)
VSGEGDVRIEGQVEGDVRVSGSLVIDAGASVQGNAAARSVEIDGALAGDVAAEGPVAIRGNARVEGNVSGSEITLDETAAFVGRIDAEFELPDGLEGVSARPRRYDERDRPRGNETRGSSHQGLIRNETRGPIEGTRGPLRRCEST